MLCNTLIEEGAEDENESTVAVERERSKYQKRMKINQ